VLLAAAARRRRTRLIRRARFTADANYVAICTFYGYSPPRRHVRTRRAQFRIRDLLAIIAELEAGA